MPRKRNPENKGLPERWRKKHGAFYYQVPGGKEHLWDGKKEFRLGKTLPEAHRKWADRIGDMENVRTVGQLLERYEREVIPEKAPKTAAENVRYCAKLRGVFGAMSIGAIKPQDIYQYVDRRSKKIESEEGGKAKGGLSIAKREVSMFQHVYTKAVEWGYIGRHPFKGEIRLKGEKPRTRYVSDEELEQCLSLPSRKGDAVQVVQAYLRLKLLTGLRQGDLLRLTVHDMQDDGIHVTPAKTQNSTGKTIIIEWTPALREAVGAAMALRHVDISPWLFCTRKGQKYSTSGWQSIWQRFMARLLKETEVTERFTEHDIRAKTGSDAKTDEDASKLLGHESTKITKKVYRRKAIKVQPLH